MVAGVRSLSSSYVPGVLMLTSTGLDSVTFWRSSNATICVSLSSAPASTDAGGLASSTTAGVTLLMWASAWPTPASWVTAARPATAAAIVRTLNLRIAPPRRNRTRRCDLHWPGPRDAVSRPLCPHGMTQRVVTALQIDNVGPTGPDPADLHNEDYG